MPAHRGTHHYLTLSHQDGYRLVAAHIHGDFIELPHWEKQVTDTMTQDPTKSHYPNTECTSACPILVMLNARLGNDKYQFYKSLVELDQEPNSQYPAREIRALPLRPPGPVMYFRIDLSKH